MAKLLRGTPAPAAPMPEPSNAPKTVVKEVVIQKELRGEPGRDGKDGVNGKDGRNAFPDGLVRFRANYSGVGTDRRFEGMYVVESDMPSLPVGFAYPHDQFPKFADGRAYRVIICGELGVGFSPVGTEIKLFNTGFTLGKVLPSVIKLPTFMSRLPAFSLAVYVEYMKNAG